MITEALIQQIKKGREGKNQGLPTGLPKLESVIDGVMPETYTLVMSGSGIGKTSIALYSFIYQPLKHALETGKFRVIYYSLEMSAEILFAKLLSIYIFDTYGVELSAKEILSRKKGFTMTDGEYELIEKCIPWLEQIEKYITIFDKGLNATILYSTLMTELEKYGSFKEEENKKIYTPNDPDVITIVVIDHMSLIRPESGHTLKQEMDLVSSYLVTLRNRCKISPLVIMQTNREAASMERRREGLSNMTINDAKDSGGPSQDSEVMIGLFNPNRERLNTYRGYDIRQLGNNFRVITVIKNRYGESDIEIPCSFYGRCGIFSELPKPEEIYDYSKYENPDWLKQKDEHVNEDSNSNNLNFTL